MKLSDSIRSPRLWVLMFVVIIASVLRLFVNIPNFTPILAIALFGGSHFNSKRVALVVPLVIMAFTDLVMTKAGIVGSVYLPMIPWVYGSFILASVIGVSLRKKSPVVKHLLGSTLSVAVFFLVTNFASWVVMSDALNPSWFVYSRSISGLLSCYVAAIPYVKATAVSTFIYSGVFIYAFHLVEVSIPSIVNKPVGVLA